MYKARRLLHVSPKDQRRASYNLTGEGGNTSFCIYMFGNRFEKKVLEMEEKGRSVRFMLLFFPVILFILTDCCQIKFSFLIYFKNCFERKIMLKSFSL